MNGSKMKETGIQNKNATLMDFTEEFLRNCRFGSHTIKSLLKHHR